MLQLDFGDHRPLYEQIKEKLKELIISGVLKENEKLPSVRELATMLTINPNTVQKSYKDLESEGYIYSMKAKGNFVSSKKEAANGVDSCVLIRTIEQSVEELKFLGATKEEMMNIIDKIYKEE